MLARSRAERDSIELQLGQTTIAHQKLAAEYDELKRADGWSNGELERYNTGVGYRS